MDKLLNKESRGWWNAHVTPLGKDILTKLPVSNWRTSFVLNSGNYLDINIVWKVRNKYVYIKSMPINWKVISYTECYKMKFYIHLIGTHLRLFSLLVDVIFKPGSHACYEARDLKTLGIFWPIFFIFWPIFVILKCYFYVSWLCYSWIRLLTEIYVLNMLMQILSYSCAILATEFGGFFVIHV